MRNLAIIPARGGSKRIPRKNIKDFLGKPIIAYSIEAALKSGLFEEVMVSTDDLEIAKVAKRYGAKVPFMRSTETADDFATTLSVIKEVLFCYHQKLQQKFEFVCCIYPTAPLIKKNDLAKGYHIINQENLSCVSPVVAFSYPVWRGLERDAYGKTQMIWKEYLQDRSQDMKRVYHDAGQWYWFKPSKIKDSLFIENWKTIVLNETQVQDIDSLIDWEMAEIKYKLLSDTNTVQ